MADHQVLDGQRGALGRGVGAGRPQRGLQDGEDLFRGREPLGRGVVLRTDLPQRQIRLGCQHQHHQAGVEVEFTVHQPHSDTDRDQGDGDGGEEFEHEGGEKGDPQGAQRRPAVLPGDGPDRGGLGLGPAEDLQGGQALDDIEEVARQPGEQPPLAVHPRLGGPADQDHEQRDQRKGEDDRERREPVAGDDPGQHGEGNDDRQPQLRQIAGEVVVQGVDAPGGEGGEFAGAHLQGAHAGSDTRPGRLRRVVRPRDLRLAVRATDHRTRPQPRRPLHQPHPQLGLGRRTGAVCGQLGEPGDQTTSHGDRGEQRQRCGQGADVEFVPERPDHDLGDQHRLAHDQARSGKPEHHHRDQKTAGGAGVAEQTRVDGFHVKQSSC